MIRPPQPLRSAPGHVGVAAAGAAAASARAPASTAIDRLMLTPTRPRAETCLPVPALRRARAVVPATDDGPAPRRPRPDRHGEAPPREAAQVHGRGQALPAPDGDAAPVDVDLRRHDLDEPRPVHADDEAPAAAAGR